MGEGRGGSSVIFLNLNNSDYRCKPMLFAAVAAENFPFLLVARRRLKLLQNLLKTFLKFEKFSNKKGEILN